MTLTDLQGRNRYFGWYSGGSAYAGYTGYDGFAKQMAVERLNYPDWKVIISEYGAEGTYGFHVNKPVRFDHSETYMIDFHKAYWDYIAKTDWIAGSTLWTMFDFVSFAKVGNVPHINQKGMMTYDRQPKSLYYYYQSQWTTDPMVYINSHTHTHRTGDLTQPQPVEVFSNCHEVELFVNGKSAGKRLNGTGFVWNVLVTEGYHTLKAIGTHEGETVRTTLRVHYAPGGSGAITAKGKDSD